MSSADDWIEWMRRKAEGTSGQPAGTGQRAAPGPGAGQQPVASELASGERQGSTEHAGSAEAASPASPVRQGNGRRHGSTRADESDPRKPGDPPWRGRTARRSSSPEATAAFRDARLRRGWTLTVAAEQSGVSRPHLSLLERGLRRPSESVAEDIIAAYKMTDAEADAVNEIAVPWAGRDSPYRTGDAPDRW
ncbi:MAG TPA: helix-turn-helix transcriptional regulator [Trebonia sp.]|nr:helix-turn-helix transcriptional regulator [Trebonia sp.]